MASADPFNHAVNTANIWLADVADALGTSDRRLVHRTTRAWLHCLRDRLTVESAVKFGAQLPLLMRGIFYEGWEPSRVPAGYGVEGFVQRFATEAGIGFAQAPAAAAAVTGVLATHMSPGQMAETLAAVPTELRAALRVTTPASTAGPHGTAGQAQPPAGGPDLAQLQQQISSLTDAVRTLARSLERANLTGIDTADVARAARLADEILIGSGR